MTKSAPPIAINIRRMWELGINLIELKPQSCAQNIVASIFMWGLTIANILARKCFLNKVQAVKMGKRRIN